MDDRLTQLKTDFIKFTDLKQDNVHTLTVLDGRIKKIKQIYSEFIQTNREHLFIFTLDSFYFQSKLIDIEYEDILRVFHSITNRMYCDYYKLFKIIIDYVFQNIPDKKLIELIHVNDHFPVYKDLEPFKQYDFQHIQHLHEILLVILTYLYGHITNKEHDLKIYQTKNKIGLNIDSFVNTLNFNNTVMKEKINLFVTYIEFFHKLHTKYFRRFTTKTQLLLSQINNDIKLDNPMEAHDKKKEIMNEFAENNIDKDILRELRHSISDDSSSTSTYSSSNPFEPIQEETHANRDSNTLPSSASSHSIVTNEIELSVIDVEEGNFYDISELSQDDNHIIKPKFSVMKTIAEKPPKNSPKESIEKPLKASSKKPSDKPSDKVRPTLTPELVDTSITESHVTELLTPPGSPVPIISMNKLIPDGMYLSSESNDEYVFTV
jgi:hypothetical protein